MLSRKLMKNAALQRVGQDGEKKRPSVDDTLHTVSDAVSNPATPQILLAEKIAVASERRKTSRPLSSMAKIAEVFIPRLTTCRQPSLRPAGRSRLPSNGPVS